MNAVTPVDEEHVDVRFSFWLRKDGPVRLGQALASEICRQQEEDIPIWEHKIHRLQPVRCAGDRSILPFRRWSKRFL